MCLLEPNLKHVHLAGVQDLLVLPPSHCFCLSSLTSIFIYVGF